MQAAEDLRSGVGIGFIGAGNVLPAYLQVVDRLAPQGLAWLGPVCARRLDTWSDLKARRPVIDLVEHSESVLRSDVDVIVIITPPETHAELARRALERGKHVVCEKPVSMSRAEAEPIFALAHERGLHLMAAPFVQLSPTLRDLWTRIADGAIGRVHSARGLYGNPGSTWATWFHAGGVGPMAEAGVYNLKSLTCLLGPVAEVYAAEALAVSSRVADATVIDDPDPDVAHVVLRHEAGALSSVVASQAIQRYRRPAIELYGTEGTANLLGDDWDPTGFEMWRNERGSWELVEPLDATWLWADGLRELVMAIVEQRAPLAHADQDLHLLEVLDASRTSARERVPVEVRSRHEMPDLRLDLGAGRHHLHDHTRPADEQ